MFKVLIALVSFAAMSALLCGCSVERLPAEDLEVPVLNAKTISVLKDPLLRTNSKEKYDAARELNKRVDLTFVRETKTINELFYYGDALIDSPNAPDRVITFNYQYLDHYIRFVFYTYRNFVHRVDIVEQ